MRRILDIRIVRWELKLAYVVGAYLFGFAISSILGALGAVGLALGFISFFFDLTAILLGARIFRGRGEPIEPPRPWWRMTARPTMSRRLGILFLALPVWMTIGIVLAAIGAPILRTTAADAAAVVVVLEFSVIGALYLNSAARLKRQGVPAEDPKFRPTIRLKS